MDSSWRPASLHDTCWIESQSISALSFTENNPIRPGRMDSSWRPASLCDTWWTESQSISAFPTYLTYWWTGTRKKAGLQLGLTYLTYWCMGARIFVFFNHMHVTTYTTHVLIMYGFKLTCTRLRAVGISVDVAAGSYRRTIHTNTHTPAFVPPLIPARPANMHTYPNTCVHTAVDLQEINTERGHVSFSLLKRDKCWFFA